MNRFINLTVMCFALVWGVLSCQQQVAVPATAPLLPLTKLFPTVQQPASLFSASIIASSVLDLSQGKARVMVPVSNGLIAALDAKTGQVDWQVNLPAPHGAEEVQLVATPVLAGDKLIVLYQCLEQSVRISHRLAVLDLARQQLDSEFPILEINAEKSAADGKGTVKFNPKTAFSHAELKHILPSGSKWGLVYAGFGNSSDVQPFHGWLFEIDLDAWHQHGPQHAVRNVLLTTPESTCPVTLFHGTQEMICGGGIWSPAGITIVPDGSGDFDLFVPTGNGQVDIARHDYSNAVLKLKPGLQFHDGCDRRLCQNFDPLNPSESCISSCKNLFIPRLMPNDAPIKPADGECDRRNFWECLAWLDFDLGANTPIKVTLKDGRSVLVQPGKDGGVYLIDAEHLGVQYDRMQIAEVCGTPTDGCARTWMGMIVTEPVQSQVAGEPVVVIPTFMPDKSHPAGLVALKITLENGQPTFKRFWQFPNPNSPEALQAFRSHPSLPAITRNEAGDDVVWIVDIGLPGTLYGVRIKDGQLMAKQTLQGTGRQQSRPLVYQNSLYIASIKPSTGQGFIEAYQVEIRPIP